MLKLLWFILLSFSPLMAEQAPAPKPKIVLEAPEAASVEDTPVEQYSLHNKIYNMLFSLGVIVVSVMTVTFVFKRLTRKRLESANASGTIKVLEKRSLTAKTTLYVIEAHNKTLLIGESPTGLVTLGELAPEDVRPAAVPDSGALSFTQILKRKFEELKP